MKTCWRAIRYYMVKIGRGVMAPSGVIYDLEKKHRVTMIQRTTKTKIRTEKLLYGRKYFEASNKKTLTFELSQDNFCSQGKYLQFYLSQS